MPFPPEATLADVGEFGLIAELMPLFKQHEQVMIGPGDDAAVLRIREHHVVVSTDLLVEGRHFRTDWAEGSDIGHRAAAQSISDLNAMGGRAHSLTVGLAVPSELPVRWALDFAAGFAAECELVGASVVGGDLTRNDDIVIAVTVIGACIEAPVLRSGARAGDVLAICGRQGWSAGGLAVLSRGFRSPRVLVDAYRRPEPPYDEGLRAAEHGATSMIDVSDGLLADAGAPRRGLRRGDRRADRPARRTGAAARRGPGHRRRPGLVRARRWRGPLAAGHVPAADAELPDGWTIIGAVSAGEGVTVDGAAYDGPTGWTHF